MNQHTFVDWLRARVPSEWWESIWWLAPMIMLLLLPVGAVILRGSAMIGWIGAARATQGLMLLSNIGGPVIGLIVLLNAKKADLSPQILGHAQWLARFAIVGPFLTLLIMFWIAGAI